MHAAAFRFCGSGHTGPRAGKTPDRKFNIRRAAVLGAGTMGARIAAHIANAGLPVLLLDIVPEKGERNSLAAQALNSLKSSKPAAFAVPSIAVHISVGNFEDDLPRLRECDWVIEAVAENLEIKRSLLSKVAAHLRPEAVFTTNTSGLPVATDRRPASRAATPSLVRDPLFQSAALYAPARSHRNTGN